MVNTKDNWRNVNILEVCTIQVGKTPSRDNNSYWGAGYPWLSIRDMNGKRVFTHTKESITQKAVDECRCKIVPVNTVIYSFKLSIGKVGITGIPMYTNEAIAAFLIKDLSVLDTNYLAYVLEATDFSGDSNKAVMGKTLNKRLLGEFEIPLPELSEQKEIVRELDRVNLLIQKRKESINLLDEYLKSVFLEMFGSPLDLNNNTERVEMSDLGKIVTGNTPSRLDPSNFGSYIEWIKSDNLNNNEYYLTKATEYLSEKGSKIGRIVPAGSVLVTCIAGSLDCIGNAGIADRPVSFNQQINAIVPNKRILTEFLYYQILVGKKLFHDASNNSMKGMLNKSNFSKIRMILPPMDLQYKFKEVFKSVVDLKKKNEMQLLDLENLNSSLMQEIFSKESNG
jgi:type I restriction enzyme S subunit